MVDRRRLTRQVVAGLAPPDRGERWIADTELRGFGIRLWAAREGPGLAYAIRVTDREGRKIRRTFSGSPGFEAAQRDVCFGGGWDDPHRASIPWPPPLSLLLDHARAWAREEIQRAKLGESDADRTRRLLAAEAARLGALSLDEAVEEFRQTSRFLSRTEACRDRLDAAYHNNLPEDLRKRALEELGGDVFEQAFEALPISDPQRRLVRGMLGPVFERVRLLGGPSLWFKRWPGEEALKVRVGRPDAGRDAMRAFQRPDFERLLKALRQSEHGWRAALRLEACLLTRAPVSRVMQGRWSRVSGEIWYPWGPDERRHWRTRSERLDGDLGRCLEKARTEAAAEGTVSDFWFPSETDPARPIRNIDRPWRAARKAAGWPDVSLKAAQLAFDEAFRGERLRDLADILDFSTLEK